MNNQAHTLFPAPTDTNQTLRELLSITSLTRKWYIAGERTFDRYPPQETLKVPNELQRGNTNNPPDGSAEFYLPNDNHNQGTRIAQLRHDPCDHGSNCARRCWLSQFVPQTDVSLRVEALLRSTCVAAKSASDFKAKHLLIQGDHLAYGTLVRTAPSPGTCLTVPQETCPQLWFCQANNRPLSFSMIITANEVRPTELAQKKRRPQLRTPLKCLTRSSLSRPEWLPLQEPVS